ICLAFGGLLFAMKDHSAAFDQMHQAIAIQRDLVAAIPTQAGLRYNLIPTLSTLAAMHLDLNQLPQAGTAVEEARQIADSVVKDGSYPMRLPSMARVYFTLGRFHAQQKTGQARNWYAKSLALLDEWGKSGVPPVKLNARRLEVQRALALAK
ncbi:MAG: tetratricopeptide repeat protein, partial [Bryobacterales bacterium]|nr:tetratricopeptide repeat protein [Bryobacterales bacterium]